MRAIETLIKTLSTEEMNHLDFNPMCFASVIEAMQDHTNMKVVYELETILNRTERGSILEEYLTARIEQLK